jgi:hypothetical protein
MYQINIFCTKRTKKSLETDKRLSLTTDILNGIRVIKMNCWEQPFKKMIKLIRKYKLFFFQKSPFQVQTKIFCFQSKELVLQLQVFCVNAVNSLLETILPQIISFIAITIYIFTTNNPLLPEYVVLIIGNYYVICSQFDSFNKALVCVLAGYVSLQRMQIYLMEPEVLKIEPKRKHFKDQHSIVVKNLTANFDSVLD